VRNLMHATSAHSGQALGILLAADLRSVAHVGVGGMPSGNPRECQRGSAKPIRCAPQVSGHLLA